MTPEQKQAFHEARQVVGVIKRGRNQYAVRFPWRETHGHSTETAASWPYITALQVAARYTAWRAMEILGYEPETIESVIGDYPTGGALAIYKDALAKAGEV